MSDERYRTEQALRDERALRTQAEERAARATEQAAIWRRRAEERAARIEELREAKRPLLGRRPAPKTAPSSPTKHEALDAKPVRQSRSHPTIRVASAVTHAAAEPLLAMVDRVEFTGAPPPDADLVVAGAAEVARWSGEAIAAFEEWLLLPGRQPLAIWGDPGRWRGQAEVTMDERTFPTFAIRPVDPPDERELIRVEASELSDPKLVALAAAGAPLVVGGANPPSAVASVAARRWAYRHSHPARRIEQLLEKAGVPAPPSLPTVAAVLVSNRPDRVPDQIDALSAQTHDALEIVVGLHGHAITPEIRAALDRASGRGRTSLAAFPSRLTLGECFNASVSTSTGELIAKIDDDDFYGPAHIEDAVHAFDYSTADIVGKTTQFTYLADEDRTVLRRPGQEETVTAGTPTGASMVFRRSLWEDVKFPHRPRFVDLVFTRAARLQGANVYANSRWEFCYVRSGGGHTWDAAPATLKAGAAEAFSGFKPEAMVVPDGVSGL